MAAQIQPVLNVLTAATGHVTFPESELHSVRCAVCRNRILFLEDLHVLDGLPVCARHAGGRYSTELHAPDGGAVVLVG